MSVSQPPRNVEAVKPLRVDPMSFSSILSSTTVDPPKTAIKPELAMKHLRRSSKTPNGDVAPVPVVPTAAAVTPTMSTARKSSHKSPAPHQEDSHSRDRIREPWKHKTPKNFVPTKVVPITSDKENESVQQALAEINAMDLSDIETPDWATERERYRQLSQKRQITVGEGEASKRKVCHTQGLMPARLDPHEN